MKRSFSFLPVYARATVKSSMSILALLPFTAHSEEITWLPDSGLWSEPGNWSGGSVPKFGSSDEIAIVEGGRTAFATGIGSLFSARHLIIGDNGEGTVEIGFLSEFLTYETILGLNSSLGVAHVWGNATWTNSTSIILGLTGRGELNIESGRVETPSLSLGLLPGKSGTVMMDGGTLAAYDVTIGEWGIGEVMVSGGSVQFGEVLLGYRANSEGSIMLSNSSGARGVLQAQSFTKGEGASNITFDGGILRAGSSQSDIFLNFNSGDVSFNAGGGFIDTNGFDVGITNALGGTGGLTKQGTGSMTLRGSNSYQGRTTVEGGTLILDHDSALGTGEVRVNAGTLHINEGVAPTNAITLAGSGSVKRDFGAAADLTNALTVTSSLEGGAETTLSILDGTTSATAALTATFAVTSGASNDMMRQSDVLDLGGVPVVDVVTGETDMFVLQLQTSAVDPGSILAWLDPNTNLWVNAVDGNFGGTPAFQGDGSYDPSTDFVLGYYGVDTSDNSAWAVINHNSEFGVYGIPEPSIPGLLGIGLSGVFLRRRR